MHVVTPDRRLHHTIVHVIKPDHPRHYTRSSTPLHYRPRHYTRPYMVVWGTANAEIRVPSAEKPTLLQVDFF